MFPEIIPLSSFFLVRNPAGDPRSSQPGEEDVHRPEHYLETAYEKNILKNLNIHLATAPPLSKDTFWYNSIDLGKDRCHYGDQVL